MRLARPLEGSWRGASGATRCRISDISISGCFVQSLAMPSMGETTEITIEFAPDARLTLTGSVVYAERGMGFAIRFVAPDAETAAALAGHIEALGHQK